MQYTDRKAVAAAMYDLGIGVTELAKRAQISAATAYRVAKGSGKVSPETLRAVGDVLGVKPSSLLLAD